MFLPYIYLYDKKMNIQIYSDPFTSKQNGKKCDKLASFVALHVVEPYLSYFMTQNDLGKSENFTHYQDL